VVGFNKTQYQFVHRLYSRFISFRSRCALTAFPGLQGRKGYPFGYASDFLPIRSSDRNRRKFEVALGLLVGLIAWPHKVLAETCEIRAGQSFKLALEKLRPGDTLIVHQGTYSESGRVSITVRGTASAPVMITGAEGEATPLITRPASAEEQSTIHIEGATHLTIKGLEITGNGGDGVRLLKAPSFITLEDLTIHNIDVGINFRSSMHHITVRRNHIYQTGALGGTGEAMYVGCNYAECAVSNSIIEGNWIHDTLQASQGDGIEIKRGSHSNVIRDNTLYNTNYPCIVLYGTEGNERNLVEKNVMWDCGEAGIQAAADAVIQNNIIFGGPGVGFLSQDHQEVTPNNLEFVHNTVVGGSPCIRLSDWNHKLGLIFANNAVYCESPLRIFGLEGVSFSGNVVYPTPSGLPAEGYVVGHSPLLDFADAWDRNVYPSENSALIGAGDTLYVTERDFNGVARREVPDAGAYTWIGRNNTGWKIGPGFKEKRPEKASRLLSKPRTREFER